MTQAITGLAKMSTEETKAAASVGVESNAGGVAQLPAFWRDDAEGWFQNCEAQFVIKGIKDPMTKYYYCLAKLDSDIARRVRDIVRAPTDSGTYDRLRNRLCLAYELTDDQRVDKMLTTSALGDRKPTELMAELLELCPREAEATTFIKRIFIRALPPSVGSALSQAPDMLPIPLAEAADKAWHYSCMQAAQVNALTTSARGGAAQLCYWHKKWGDQARRCNKTCPRFDQHMKNRRRQRDGVNEVEAATAWEPNQNQLPKNA